MEHKKPTDTTTDSGITYENALFFFGSILLFGIVIALIDKALDYLVSCITHF